MRVFDPELPETADVTSALPGAPHNSLQLVHDKGQTVVTHKRRPPAEVAADSAGQVRQARLDYADEQIRRQYGAFEDVASTTGRSPMGQSSIHNGPRAPGKARTSFSPPEQSRACKPSDTTLPSLRVDRGGIEKPTESFAHKIQAEPANRSDRDGWGPVERVTIAALEFGANRKRLPKEYQAFTELAEWVLANLEAGCVKVPLGWQNPKLADSRALDAVDACADDVTPSVASRQPSLEDDDTYFRVLTQRLLAINRESTAALLDQPPPQADMLQHNARQLWRSIPLPAHMPAEREHAEQLSVALDMALREIGAPHSVEPLPERCCRDAEGEELAMKGLRAWNPRGDIAEERAVWRKLEVELTRQVEHRCHRQGDLLCQALNRREAVQQELLSILFELKQRMIDSRSDKADLYQKVADLQKDKYLLQKKLDTSNDKIKVLNDEVRLLAEKHEEMIKKYRRGRWDVIETELAKHKKSISREMEAWMEEVRCSLQASYDERVVSAVKEALDGKVVGAFSSVQQPELA